MDERLIGKNIMKRCLRIQGSIPFKLWGEMFLVEQKRKDPI